MSTHTVQLEMREATGRVVNREIDGSNLFVHMGGRSYVASDPEVQRKLILEWIEDRGNDQHATTLELISWAVIVH